MTTTIIRISFVFTLAVFAGLANAVPMQQPQQQTENGGAAGSGYATVLWSVLNDCFDSDTDEPATVCLKTKALTALDRALSKPTVTVVDGVVLAARAGKSLPVDQQAEKADRAALVTAKDSEQKNALLDDMLANRMGRLMSTRTIVLDGPEGQEGRKKKDKALQQALMMVVMTAVAVLGPLTFQAIALLAGKALLFSKLALVISGLLALKKLSQPQHTSHGSDYHRSIIVNDHDMAYSGQNQ